MGERHVLSRLVLQAVDMKKPDILYHIIGVEIRWAIWPTALPSIKIKDLSGP